MKIGELFVALGYDIEQSDQNKIQKFELGLSTAKVKAVALATAVTVTTQKIIQFSDAAIKYAVNLKNFAIQTGLSVRELEKWRFVAERNDVSGEELINTIKGIQKAQAEIRLGTGNIRPWQLLGIDPNENPFEILEQLRSTVKNLEPALAASVLSQLGVSQNFLNILKVSNLEFDKLNEKFLLTEKETKDLLDLNRTVKNLIFSVRGLRNRLFAISTVSLKKIINAFKNATTLILDVVVKVKELTEKFSFLRNI